MNCTTKSASHWAVVRTFEILPANDVSWTSKFPYLPPREFFRKQHLVDDWVDQKARSLIGQSGNADHVDSSEIRGIRESFAQPILAVA
jgi:hypothetical protein